MRPAWTGVQSSRSQVIAADVGLSIGASDPRQPKWSCTSAVEVSVASRSRHADKGAPGVPIKDSGCDGLQGCEGETLCLVVRGAVELLQFGTTRV
jgi:hypothetical protein